MEKMNFFQLKNQFPQAEVRFLLKRLLPLNFEIFNRALNKTTLFLLDRSFVSTGPNEEFVKKMFLWEKLFSLPAISHKLKKRFLLTRKQFLLGAMKNFCKNWLFHSFNNSCQQQKEYYNTKEYYVTQTKKDFTALIFASGNYY